MLDRIRKCIRNIKRKVHSFEPCDIANYKRIPVIHTYDLPEHILGMFSPVGAKGVIYLKPDMLYEQEKFVLSHELFHAIFRHKGLSLTSTENMYNPDWVTLSKQELEAHMGAACLILDIHEFDHGYICCCEIARMTGCPEKIVERWIKLGGLKKGKGRK